MFQKLGLYSLLLCMMLTGSGCNFLGQHFFSDMIGHGVTRLSVRNAADVMLLLQSDEVECGFESDWVKSPDNYELVPDNGSLTHGSVTYKVTDCKIQLDQKKLISTDCLGNEVWVKGAVVVNATQVIHGRLTGNPAQPVVPINQGDVTISVTAEFDEFEPTHSDDENVLRIKSGIQSFEVTPHLARSALEPTKDLCVVPTSDVAFNNVSFQGVEVALDVGLIGFDVPVSHSNVEVETGLWEDKENFLAGSVTVWDKHIKVPTDGDGLNPNYERADFEKTFSCKEDLAGVVSYKCLTIDEKLAQGVGSLSALTFGQIADSLDIDTDCGFSNPDVVQYAEVVGEVGKSGAKATFSLPRTCELKFDKTLVDEDCHGVKRYAEGVVRVTKASKVVKGRRVLSDSTLWKNGELYRAKLATSETKSEKLSAKPEPILPEVVEPAILKMELDFTDFRVYNTCSMDSHPEAINHCSKQDRWKVDRAADPDEDNIKSSASMMIKNGTLTGKLIPRVGYDPNPMTREYGVCGKKTSVATLQELQFKNANVELLTDGNQFPLYLTKTSVNGYSGITKSHENILEGQVTIDDKEHVIQNLDGSYVSLDPSPDYSNALFLDGFLSCDDSKSIPESDETCDLTKMLSENVGRLIIQNLGGAAKVLSAGVSPLDIAYKCSFLSPRILSNPLFSEDENVVTYTISDCDKVGNQFYNVFGGRKELSVDNNGDKMYAEGTFYIEQAATTISGNRIAGVGTGISDLLAARNKKELHIHQNTPESIVLTISGLVPHSFTSYTINDGADEAAGKMYMNGGTLAATILPIMGESRSEPDHYFVPTPIATFEDVKVSNSKVKVVTGDGMEFLLEVEEANLSARNGYYKGEGNYISGTVKLKDRRVIELDRLPLVPPYPEGFDPDRFESGYVVEELRKPVASGIE